MHNTGPRKQAQEVQGEAAPRGQKSGGGGNQEGGGGGGAAGSGVRAGPGA